MHNLILWRDLALSDLIRSIIQMLRLSKKSSRDEYLLYLKLTALGVAVVGILGFIIKIVGSVLQLMG
ncbi:MAG: protein translocase SEC61 complex subunit gamma [Nitrososphaerales archaeon]